MILQRGFLMPLCFWGFSPFMNLGITLPLYGMAYEPPCPTISLFTFRSFRFHWVRSARSFAYGRDRAALRNILTLGWPGRSRGLSRRFLCLFTALCFCRRLTICLASIPNMHVSEQSMPIMFTARRLSTEKQSILPYEKISF